MELNPLVQKCNQTLCQGAQGKAPPGQGRTISDTELHSPWVLTWGLLFAEACEGWGKKWTGGDELQWRISHQLANHVH